MSDDNKIDINMEHFLTEVKSKVKEGMSYRDAILLTSLTFGGSAANLVKQADTKFQEATFQKTKLSKQPNVDECALASMDKLWDGEHFEGSTEQMPSSNEETILDTLYFILKYAESENALESVLAANDAVCGDKRARKAFLEMAFKV
jgi:hypothetical protein